MITKHIKKRLKYNVSLYKKTGNDYFIIECYTLIVNAYRNGYITGKQTKKWLDKYVNIFPEINHL